jgi:hypothetical protein
MRRSVFTGMLVALLFCTQTLLAVCGLRCDIRATGSHTFTRQQAQTKAKAPERGGVVTGMQSMGGCHPGMVPHSRHRSGAAWEHPCCTQHCGQDVLQVSRNSPYSLDPYAAQAQVSASSMLIGGVPLGGVPLIVAPPQARSHLRPRHAIFDPLSRSVLNLRV